MTALVSDMFHNFFVLKIISILSTQQTQRSKEWEILEFYKLLGVCFSQTVFKSLKIYNKANDNSLKLFSKRPVEFCIKKCLKW